MIYLYKNKSLAKTNEQLRSIGTVMATNLLMGSIQETAIDNVGEPPSCHLHVLAELLSSQHAKAGP